LMTSHVASVHSVKIVHVVNSMTN